MLKYLLEKEFKQIFRNSFLPKMFVMLPTVMLLIMPWAANQEVKNLKLSVVDNDHSTMSQKLVNKATSTSYFTLTDYSPSYNEALKSVQAGKSDVVLVIEKDFEKNVSSSVGKVFIASNAVNGVKGGMGSSYMANIVNDFSNDLKQEYGTQVASSKKGFQIKPYYAFNAHLDYKVYMIPALMVMMLTMLSGFLPALNIVGEKEKGTMEQINVTPIGKFQFILSKLIPYWCVGFFVLTYSMLLAWIIYGLTPSGNILLIYLFTTIYVLVVSGLGLIISNYSSTMIQALFLMFFFLMVFILTSGLFTPVESMPMWAQYLTTLNPLKYFIQVMRMVYLKGSGFFSLIPQLLSLIVFALVLDLWAVKSYKKSA